MAEATPGWVAVAVQVLIRLSAMTCVAVMTAMRCPSMVMRYGANAWAAVLPMPTIG